MGVTDSSGGGVCVGGVSDVPAAVNSRSLDRAVVRVTEGSLPGVIAMAAAMGLLTRDMVRSRSQSGRGRIPSQTNLSL